jgi:hypothetical protein
VRQQLTSRAAIVGRVERYDDKNQINIATALTDPFRGNGLSLGVDVTPQPRLMWRTEARGFFADKTIFPDGDDAPRKTGGFAVTSVSLVF